MTDTLVRQLPAEGEAMSSSRPQRVPKDDEGPRAPRFLGARSVALCVLVLGLLTTVVVALFMSGQVNRENEVRLARAQDLLERDLVARVGIYAETLVGLQGLYAASDEVTRAEFVGFIEAADVFERFPGLQGLSFSPVVLRSDVARYEADVRNDTSVNGIGYPDFAVRTDGNAEDLFVVDFITPFEGNEAAFGFDLGSNPARRAAVEEARDSGLKVATSPITLVQEEDEQVGVLLLAPAYNGPADTLEERRANFVGVFSAVLRMGDFLDGASSQSEVSFAVFDQSADQVENPNGRTALYSSGTTDLTNTAPTVTIDVGSREWGIALDPLSVPRAGHRRSLIVLAGVLAALPYAAASYFSYKERDRLVRQAAELRAANSEIRRDQAIATEARTALAARGRQLETANHELEQFISLAAHDLQAPLRTISSYAVLIPDTLSQVTPETQDYLDRVTASTGRMSQLLVDLLAYSRLGWDQRPEPLELGRLAAMVVDDVIGAGDAEVTIDPSPTVVGHATHLRLLLQNLIDNAVKFAKPDEPLSIKVRYERQAAHHVISVEDNGVGFDNEYSDRVFSVFQRLPGTDHVSGTGIGLAHCQKIARMHNGDAWATSTPGVGSIFSFSLAIEPEATNQPRQGQDL